LRLRRGARTGGANRWANAALRNEIAAVLAAPTGERNETLNSAACGLAQIVAGGGLDKSDVVKRLTAAALVAGQEPDKTAGTIKSGVTAGAETPRGPKPKASQSKAHTSDGESRPNDDDEIDLATTRSQTNWAAVTSTKTQNTSRLGANGCSGTARAGKSTIASRT
jgi:hypothetical protein